MVLADMYSMKDWRVEKNWKIDFKDGTAILVKDIDGDKLIVEDWDEPGGAAGQYHELKKKNYSAFDEKPFRAYAHTVYDPQQDKYDQEKLKYETAEKKRYDEEKKIYAEEKKNHKSNLKAKYDEELKEWREDKAKEYAECKDDELPDAIEDWEEAKADFLEDEIDRINDIFDDNKELKRVHGTTWEKWKAWQEKNMENPSSGALSGEPKLRKTYKPKRYKEKKPVEKIFCASYMAKEFTDPEPQLSKAPFSKPAPKPARKYLESPPTLDKAPAYGTIGLTLLLVKNSCQKGKFILQHAGDYAFVQTRKSTNPGFSPWHGNTEVIACEIIGRSADTGKKYLQIELVDKHLISLKIGSNAKRVVSHISTPLLKDFEKELNRRETYLLQMDEFMAGKEDEVTKARYKIEQDQNFIDITYEVSGKKKNIIKTTVDTPVYIYDSAIKDKGKRVVRVSLMKSKKIKGEYHPTMLKNYWYEPNKTAKQWKFSAKYKYAIVEGTVENLIKKSTRQVDGSSIEQQVVSSGLVFDFTSMWYLVSNAMKTGKTEYAAVYYDDKLVSGMILTRKGSGSITHREGNLPPKKVDVVQWLMTDQNKKEMFQFQVGKKDSIIYSAKAGSKSIKLIELTHARIRENRAWLDEYPKSQGITLLKFN